VFTTNGVVQFEVLQVMLRQVGVWEFSYGATALTYSIKKRKLAM
jgi:hypothetical protein